MINKVCVIGVGLIGGSLALALKNAGFCQHIVGGGRNQQRLEKAQQLGIIDSYSTSLADAVKDADIVFVAVPMGTMLTVFEQIADYLKPGAVITDGGSAKLAVIADAKTGLGKHFSNFVAGHPIAGTEKSGCEAAFAELYQQRRIIITPADETEASAIDTVIAMWQAAGAEIESMTAELHDEVLAGTSHLPHLLAYGLVNCLFESDKADDYFKFAAGGFRDFTRIASSDPVMWRDICLTNKSALLDSLARYQTELDQLKSALEDNDGDQLLSYFQSAKKSRDKFHY